MLTNDRLLSWREQSLAVLRSWFPGAVIWFGARTGHWWAMVSAGLVEGVSPDELGRKLASSEVSVSSASWQVQEVVPALQTMPQPVVRAGNLRRAPSEPKHAGVGGA